MTRHPPPRRVGRSSRGVSDSTLPFAYGFFNPEATPITRRWLLYCVDLEPITIRAMGWRGGSSFGEWLTLTLAKGTSASTTTRAAPNSLIHSSASLCA